MLVTQGISELSVKKRTEARRALCRVTESRFPEARLFSLDSAPDSALLLRHLASQKQRRLAFRSRRPYLLAQSACFEPGPGPLGTLRVSGYVRGRALDVNRLVHIVGHGDFQMSQIDAPRDPLPMAARGTRGGDMDMQVEYRGQSHSGWGTLVGELGYAWLLVSTNAALCLLPAGGG